MHAFGAAMNAPHLPSFAACRRRLKSGLPMATRCDHVDLDLEGGRGVGVPAMGTHGGSRWSTEVTAGKRVHLSAALPAYAEHPD